MELELQCFPPAIMLQYSVRVTFCRQGGNLIKHNVNNNNIEVERIKQNVNTKQNKIEAERCKPVNKLLNEQISCPNLR